MTVTNNKEYEYEKYGFLRKHELKDVITSQMDEYGVYHKEYICEDGAIWYEVMSPVYEKDTVEIKRVQVEVEVKMLRTEYWSSDNAESKFYYEKF